MSSRTVLGIDPAPKKPAVTFDGSRFERVKPGALRDHLESRLRANPGTLIAWDAPLSFDQRDYYDRLIDKATRRWAEGHVKHRRFEDGAVNARPFAGLPHWAVTCSVLGLPFGLPPAGLRLAASRADLDLPCPLVIEVHPAVALGIWWLSAKAPMALPRYKANAEACRSIVSVLGFPVECEEDDDALDAYVAYRLGAGFIEGWTSWVGSPDCGGYVLPDGTSSEELRGLVASLRSSGDLEGA
ncbi:MAG: hypothetical protein ACYC4P_16115 [Thermoanaerobaculia bacterium]